MLGRLDIPVRDVLLVVTTGVYATFVTDTICTLVTGEHLLAGNNQLHAIGLSLFYGLFSHVAVLHRWCWPWRRHWADGLERIRQQILSVTGNELVCREKWAGPIYKIWMESMRDRSVRAHIHYTTGLFYTMVAFSFTSGLGSVALLASYVVYERQMILTESWRFLYSANGWPMLGVAGVGMLFAFLAYRESLRIWERVITTGIIAIRRPLEEHYLHSLAAAAGRADEAQAPAETIERAVKSAVGISQPASVEKILSVNYDGITQQFDLRMDSYRRIAHITLTSTEPETINGGPNLYGGPIQKDISHEVRVRLAGTLNVQDIRLQIKGRASLTDCKTPQGGEKLVSSVAVDEAIRLNIIQSNGCVAQCCKRYGLSNILLRNRRLVGPSPGLGEIVRRILLSLPSGVSVYDPFAGTFLIRAVCREIDKNVEVIAHDMINGAGEGTGFDAFREEPSQDFDLVVIDPMYEDVIPYLQVVAPKLKFKHLVVQSGDDCDVIWNSTVGEMLQNLGSRVEDYKNVDTYGKKIWVVRKLQP